MINRFKRKIQEANTISILLIFSFLSLFLILNHEPWRDEAQAWLIARDIPDVPSLISLMGYEGTPALWHLILSPFAKLSFPYFSMAIINFFITLSVIFVFVKYAPFSKWQKPLFIFSYYIFYEYNVIARNYSLSVLLLFLIAAIYGQRFKRIRVYPLLLLLLAGTNVHGLIISFILSTFYIYELIFEKRYTKKNSLSLAIIAFGLLIAVYQLLPQTDLSPHLKQWRFNQGVSEIVKSLEIVLNGAFLPIPQLRVDFWNTLLTQGKLGYITAFLSLFVSISLLKMKTKPTIIYLLLVTSLIGLFIFKYPGAFRHYGLLFVIFVFSLWVSKEYKETIQLKNRLLVKLLNLLGRSYLFSLILVFQVLASMVAFYYDINYDFSAGKKVASFLKNNNFINEDTFIATHQSFATSSILPYLPNSYSRFYRLEYQDYGSFMIWNKEWYDSKVLESNEIMSRVDHAVKGRSYKDVLVILNRKVKDETFLDRYNVINCFEGTIQEDESFCLYQLKK